MDNLNNYNYNYSYAKPKNGEQWRIWSRPCTVDNIPSTDYESQNKHKLDELQL